MLRTTIWRDLRWRLLAATLLVAIPVALVMLGYHSDPAAQASRDYLLHLDRHWFRLPGGSAVLLPAAVLLGASGTLMRPRRDVAFMLTLPISRRRWVLAHLEAPAVALALLVLATDAAYAAGAVRAGAALPVVPLLARSIGAYLAAAAWIPAATLLMVLGRHPAIVIPLALAGLSYAPGRRFLLDLPAGAATPMLPAWDPWALADPRAWTAGVPLASLAMATLLAAGSTLAAVWLFERLEL